MNPSGMQAGDFKKIICNEDRSTSGLPAFLLFFLRKLALKKLYWGEPECINPQISNVVLDSEDDRMISILESVSEGGTTVSKMENNIDSVSKPLKKKSLFFPDLNKFPELIIFRNLVSNDLNKLFEQPKRALRNISSNTDITLGMRLTLQLILIYSYNIYKAGVEAS